MKRFYLVIDAEDGEAYLTETPGAADQIIEGPFTLADGERALYREISLRGE